MTQSYRALSSKNSSMDKLKSEMTKMSGEKAKKDERFWYPNVDKAGNGYAIIRFLDAPQGEDMPFVRIWTHGFQGPGGWYIENSLTTINKVDPVSELNSSLWNESTDDNSPGRKQARAQKRKLTFIANILVIKDSANPENEGKVFLYKFGKKIFDMIKEKTDPQFEDEKPLNPFDMINGANFKVKIRNADGYRNYDKSEFDEPSAISTDDDTIDKIWSQCYSLQAFVAPDQFKSYKELSERLTRVLNGSPKRETEDTQRSEAAPARPAAAPAAGKVADAPAVAPTAKAKTSLSFFESLAEDEE